MIQGQLLEAAYLVIVHPASAVKCTARICLYSRELLSFAKQLNGRKQPKLSRHQAVSRNFWIVYLLKAVTM